MKYFSSNFTNFFKDLSKHNNTEWFHENKARFEQDVKEPFHNFITDLITELSKIDKTLHTTAKDAIFRINRDIRFSADKSPYKLNVSAILSAGGKKEKEYPGMYLQFGAEKIEIYGGAYMVEKEKLQKIRTAIAKDLKAFDKIISEKKFKETFGEIQGEKNKVLAPEFKSLLEKQPLLANKNFYYFCEMSAKEISSETLLKTVVNCFKIGKPVNDFLIAAMK